MDYRSIVLHDEAMSIKPGEAKHDASLCPICTDWSMTDDGTPSGLKKIDAEKRAKPYGDVAYADPGLREDGISRFPIGSEIHAKKSLELLSRDEVAGRYDDEQLKTIKASVENAIERFDARSSEQETSETTPTPEGGKAEVMDTLTKETHDALLAKAVQDATETATAEIARLTELVESLESDKAALETKVEEYVEENTRLNTELDTSQVKLKNAEDEVASLKEDVIKRDEQAAKAKVADERASQVKNLGLFSDDYITEKASRWADLSDEDWADRIEEWKQAKTSESTASPETDTASAMTGSSESEKKDEPSARTRVLMDI